LLKGRYLVEALDFQFFPAARANPRSPGIIRFGRRFC